MIVDYGTGKTNLTVDLLDSSRCSEVSMDQL